MKITILTYGSRGDIQPFLPLSVGLMVRGHSVRLAAPHRFRGLVEGYGIQFVPLAGEPETLSQAMNDAGYNSFKMIREFMNHAVEIGTDVLRQTEESCEEADLIIHTFAHAVGAHTFARERKIPDIHIQIFPMFTPTGDYPNVTMPDFRLRTLNRFTHIFSQKIAWWISVLGFAEVRRRAGLPRRQLYFPFDDDPLRPPTPILCAWSPNVLPPSLDWKPNVHVTGYFFFDLNDAYLPPVGLNDFLDAGSPPVCVSFGSMINRDAKKIDRVVREALVQTGQRGIVLSGWSMIDRLSTKDIFYIDAAPHDWLLPRCKMVVHHGGAGTTSAGLRAGIPNIVVPFTADQPFWGRRVHEIGAGPKPVLVKHLSVENLMQAILKAKNSDIRMRTRDIGRRIRGEDGVNRAIDMMESHVSGFVAT